MTEKPPARDVLAQAIAARHPVLARCHGTERLLCPHLLGRKSGRAKALLPVRGHDEPWSEPAQRWLSLCRGGP